MVENDVQAGKFGKIKHFLLVKKALLQVIDRYYEKYAVIMVENQKVSMNASLHFYSHFTSPRGSYELHPDITLAIRDKDDDDDNRIRMIVVECETSSTGLLTNEMRMTAYRLLRLGTPDRSKLMMYIAFPSELKGKIKKPEAFNDLWFFDLEAAHVPE